MSASAAFAASLWRLRRAAGLSQQKLAAQSGVSLSAIKHVEALTRKGGCHLETAVALARALGASLDDMTREDA